RRLAHPQYLRRHAAYDRVLGDVLGHDSVGAHDAVVPDAHSPQYARAVAHPNIAPDPYVALVDPLQPDRALHLHHAVVEVDQHHPVGDDALPADLHVLVGGDRALLAHHRLCADRHFALVHPDLRAVADPRPATDPQRRVLADLELDARAEEADAVGLQAPAPAQLKPQQAGAQHRIVAVEHVVRTHEAKQRKRAATLRWSRGLWRGGERLLWLLACDLGGGHRGGCSTSQSYSARL